MTSQINSARFIPADFTLHTFIPEMGIEIWVNVDKKSAIGYSGKSKKYSFFYRYSTVDRMYAAITEFVTREQEFTNRKAAEKTAKKLANAAINAADHFAVGDIIVNSWGWEQTNIDFFRVTSVKGKTIDVEEVYIKQVEGSTYSHGMACEVVPTNVKKENGDSYKLRIKSGYNGGAAICQPKSYYYMHKWDGRPMYCSWYA